MMLTSTLLIALAFDFATAGSPHHARANTTATTCKSPDVRREWRSLSRPDQISYVNAVNCLTTKPSISGITKTLYNEFPLVHSQLDAEIHFVAAFLPWHRYFVHIYEKALKDCGYTGVATYWDWTLDATDPSSSTIFSAETGFGGNGSLNKTETGGNCITDGPFKSLRPDYLGGSYSPHCLARNFNNGTEQIGRMLGEYYTPEAVEECQVAETYDTYRILLENGPHGAIHSGVGGDMSPNTSPNDPLFFLHHTQIDRLWWLWQQQDPEKRNTDFSGDREQHEDGVVSEKATTADWLEMRRMAKNLQTINATSLSEAAITCATFT